jgi:hypothetical protein
LTSGTGNIQRPSPAFLRLGRVFDKFLGNCNVLCTLRDHRPECRDLLGQFLAIIER